MPEFGFLLFVIRKCSLWSWGRSQAPILERPAQWSTWVPSPSFLPPTRILEPRSSLQQFKNLCVGRNRCVDGTVNHRPRLTSTSNATAIENYFKLLAVSRIIQMSQLIRVGMSSDLASQWVYIFLDRSMGFDWTLLLLLPWGGRWSRLKNEPLISKGRRKVHKIMI